MKTNLVKVALMAAALVVGFFRVVTTTIQPYTVTLAVNPSKQEPLPVEGITKRATLSSYATANENFTCKLDRRNQRAKHRSHLRLHCWG